ncbi:lytic transglycosylase domain-containing protein [Candidatus Shapirobacteria bacterium]|nr:lytic transglycosylase domain-containing protein [Candidatus Shapirobacteria bacterium]
MKKLFSIFVFFTFTPLTLLASLFIFNQLAPVKPQVKLQSFQSVGQLYAALPSETGEVLGLVTEQDARPVIIREYLATYDSPLLPYADALLEASVRYDVDYKLIVAIAQCESNLCKKAPEGSFNCWGFENGETKFLSWEQAFNQVAKTLRERYLDMGLTTPEQIMPKYAPPSVEKGGPWAKCVTQFMDDLEYGDF